MFTIPNQRFTHLISAKGDAILAAFSGIVGYLLYDSKQVKADRPDNISLYNLLQQKWRPNFESKMDKIRVKKDSSVIDEDEKAFLQLIGEKEK